MDAFTEKVAQARRHVSQGLRMIDAEDFLCLASHRYVAFDLETTGLSPKYSGITEIGAIRVVHGKRTEVFQQLVNPGMPIPYEVQQLTHITDDMVSDEPDIRTVLPRFLEFIGDDPFVAHNATFDVGFLQSACTRIQRKLPDRAADSLEVARRYWPGMRSHKLGNMAEAIGFDLRGAHRSLADTEALVALVNTAVSRNRLQIRKNHLYLPGMELEDAPNPALPGCMAVSLAVYDMEADGKFAEDMTWMKDVPCKAVRQFPGITNLYELIAVVRKAYTGETCRGKFDLSVPEKGQDDVTARIVADMCGLDILDTGFEEGGYFVSGYQGRCVDLTGRTKTEMGVSADCCKDDVSYGRYRQLQRNMISVLSRW